MTVGCPEAVGPVDIEEKNSNPLITRHDYNKVISKVTDGGKLQYKSI